MNPVSIECEKPLAIILLCVSGLVIVAVTEDLSDVYTLQSCLLDAPCTYVTCRAYRLSRLTPERRPLQITLGYLIASLILEVMHRIGGICKGPSPIYSR